VSRSTKPNSRHAPGPFARGSCHQACEAGGRRRRTRARGREGAFPEAGVCGSADAAAAAAATAHRWGGEVIELLDFEAVPPAQGGISIG